MHLSDEFSIETAPDLAFEYLLDLRRVAPCVPGAEIGEPGSDGFYPGRVSVRVGPMKFVYDGRVRIVDIDRAGRTAVIVGEGRASGGADTAKVATTMQVVEDGSGSRVRMTTDLEIKGRAAQMGQGVIADVGRRLVREAAACIQVQITGPSDGDARDGPAVSARPVGGISLMASVLGARVGDSVRRLGGRESEKGDTEVDSR